MSKEMRAKGKASMLLATSQGLGGRWKVLAVGIISILKAVSV
jgi:hypothetical protein